MASFALRNDGVIFIVVIIIITCYVFVGKGISEPGQLGRKLDNGKYDLESDFDDGLPVYEVKNLRKMLEEDEIYSGEGDKDINVECENIVQFGHSQVSYKKLENTDVIGDDLFPVRSSDVSVLKKICSALSECQGFNTNGWLKKSVRKMHPLKVDLYIKLQPLPQDLFLSAHIIEDNFGRGYVQMVEKLKIFVYPLKTGAGIKEPIDYKYGVEKLFIDLLKKSSFVTDDGDKADFYFIPTRCFAYRKSVQDYNQGFEVTRNLVREAVEEIKNSYDYWAQSLGANHFYICAHDYGASSVVHADLNMQKNAIGLVQNADSADKFFIPHKDISLPPHPSHGINSLPDIGKGGQGIDPTLRKYLAFIAGNMDRGPVRPVILNKFSKDPDFKIFIGQMQTSKYHGYLQMSKFCLCPRGNKVWSPRLMDAIWFGCVPVILADHYNLPLQGLIDWTQFAVIVPEYRIDQLKEILVAVSDTQLAAMQGRLRLVYSHLTWNDPPLPYDAFHSVLYQLWQRRHVNRYNVTNWT